MFRSTLLSLSLAALTAVALAQSTTQQPAPTTSPDYMQSQTAPIERATPQQLPDSDNQPQHRWPRGEMRVLTSQPAQGIWVRSNRRAQLETVAATNDRVELRVNSGLVNVTVHHPLEHQLILVDFAGGQVALIKDGLYTFNAQTKTARVFVGEAKAYPTPAADVKPVKVKEGHVLTFGQPSLHTVSFDPPAGRPDLLPNRSAASYGDGYGGGYGAYGFYGAPYAYYGYGDPYFWGPGWGWGYPFGFGLGFGYYGGFGGFHGRR